MEDAHRQMKHVGQKERLSRQGVGLSPHPKRGLKSFNSDLKFYNAKKKKKGLKASKLNVIENLSPKVFQINISL